jgi:hypothetical protein
MQEQQPGKGLARAAGAGCGVRPGVCMAARCAASPMAQEMLEVAGLLGRASKANGHYRRHPAQQQCGRPVYVQVVPGSGPGPGGSSSRSISTEAAARVVYDDGVRAEEQPAWIVEVPNDPGKAYAYAECDAPTPPDAVANWMVWFCPFTTSIEDGQDLWYPATDFEDFYVGTPALPDASLVRTETQRTSTASGLLDSLGAELGGLEDRVRFLDDPPRQKTLLQLHGRVTQLGAELDRLDVAGMSGEASLRGRRGALQRRVLGLLDTLETRSAAATQTPPPRASSAAASAPRPHHHRTAGSGSGPETPARVATEPEPEPEPEPVDGLHRTPSKQSRVLDGVLGAISMELGEREEEAIEALERRAAAVSEHKRGFAQSRSTLISSRGSIDRILIKLDTSRNSLQIRLDAIEIDDQPQHRDKKFQRKMLNRHLDQIIGRLEAGKRQL